MSEDCPINRRRGELLRILHYSPMTPVAELADRLGVSESTIYRDLETTRAIVKLKPGERIDVDIEIKPDPVAKSIADAWVLQIVDGHPEIGPQDHGLYWRPNSAGYTRDIAQAGIYTEAEAKKAQGSMPNPRDIARPLIEVLFGNRKPSSVGELLSTVVAPPEMNKPGVEVRGLSTVRQALTERRKLYFTYRDVATDNRSERVVQPRSLVFRGDHWSLLGWCEVREEYRSFRISRMRDLCLMAEKYTPKDALTKKGVDR